MALFALPVVFEGVGRSASSSTDAAGVVTRVTNSSSDMAELALRAADTSSNVEGVTVKMGGHPPVEAQWG